MYVCVILFFKHTPHTYICVYIYKHTAIRSICSCRRPSCAKHMSPIIRHEPSISQSWALDLSLSLSLFHTHIHRYTLALSHTHPQLLGVSPGYDLPPTHLQDILNGLRSEEPSTKEDSASALPPHTPQWTCLWLSLTRVGLGIIRLQRQHGGIWSRTQEIMFMLNQTSCIMHGA